jgi:glycosyltransferase involved in cell wall biosynthesis
MYPNQVSPLSGIFVRQQAQALSALGVKLAVIAPVPWVPRLLAGRSKWGGYPAVPEREEGGDFPVYHPRVLELPRSCLFALYPRTYARGLKTVVTEQIRQGVDLIHAHVAHPDGAAALSFGRRFGIPVVVTIHGQDFAYTLKRGRMCANSVMRTVQEARRVILVSDKLKNAYGLERWVQEPSKCRVIWNGVHLETAGASPANGQKGELQGVSGGRPENTHIEHTNTENTNINAIKGKRILLSLGFLRPDKGHAIVIRALPELLREFPNLLYRVVGDGEERARLEQLTRELGLQGQVEFMGALPHPLAMRQMAACEIFVLPSWNEAFGVVYLEAMAHGKPVIGTLGEGIAGILTEEKVGLAVPPRDVRALTEALRALLRDREAAGRMGVKGKALVAAKFTWEYNARQTLALYQEVVERG